MNLAQFIVLLFLNIKKNLYKVMMLIIFYWIKLLEISSIKSEFKVKHIYLTELINI